MTAAGQGLTKRGIGDPNDRVPGQASEPGGSIMENEIYNDEEETPEEVAKAIAQSLLFLQMEAKRHRMTKIATAIGEAYLVAIELDDN